MRHVCVIIVFLASGIQQSSAQIKEYPFYQLYQLDSIASTSSISRHFGELYAGFLRLVESRLVNADTTVRRLLRHFETVFAQFYIDAAKEYLQGRPVSHPSWKTYFDDPSLSRSQFYLLGTNAHLNGQLSEAIFHSYTPAEWKMLKKHYDLFNKCLNQTYRHVYRETLYEHPRARTLHLISFGLDKLAGNYFLYKWRKRQMRVTEYRFNNPEKHKKLFGKIQRKKASLDWLIKIALIDKKGRDKLRSFHRRITILYNTHLSSALGPYIPGTGTPNKRR